MNRYIIKNHLCYIILSLLFFSIISCSSGGVDGEASPPNSPIQKIDINMKSASISQSASDYTEIYLSISGPGIEPDIERITKEITPPIQFLIYVPPGDDRVFLAQARDSSKNVIHEGSVIVDIAPDKLVTINIFFSLWEVVAAGFAHTVAIKTDGTLWAWGYNEYGQLGDGTWEDKNTPTQIGTDTDWEAVAAGDYHSLALKTDGTLWVWGNNGYGQLGDGTTVNKNIPTRIGIDTDWSAIAAGFYHTIALKSDDTLWAWGYNNYGQLGDGTAWKDSPVQITQ